MANESMKSTAVAGFIVRSARNPHMIYCADGEFYPDGWVGIGGRAARIYKTERGAKAVRGGEVTVHPVNNYGIEISWLREKGFAS